MFLQITRGGAMHAVAGRLQETLDHFRRQQEQRRMYRATYAELAQMTDRDLDDIGISRVSISEIVHEAVCGR
jgi:uncharacterized protein YjiS (DUF1127 family)